MKPRTADLLLLLAAAAWGSGFIGMDAALDMGIPVFLLIFVRFTISGILLLPLLFARRKLLSKKLAITGLLCGLCLFAAYVFQTYALYYTTPSKNAFYTALYTLMVPFLYWLILKRRPHKFVFIALIPTSAGIFALNSDSFSELSRFNFGDFLTMLCAVFFALQILLLGIYNRKYDPILMTIFQIFCTSILSLFFTVLFEPFTPVFLEGSAFLLIFYLSISCTLLAFTLQNIAQKHTTQSRTAICMSTESVFGAFFSVLFGAELFTYSMLIGGGLIVLGVITLETKFSFLFSKRAKHVPAEKKQIQ